MYSIEVCYKDVLWHPHATFHNKSIAMEVVLLLPKVAMQIKAIRIRVITQIIWSWEIGEETHDWMKEGF